MGHWSSCAVHNEPAFPAGDCDCGGYEPEAVSFSHWGMFEVRPAFFILPAGYTVKDLEAARVGWNCPDGFIEIVRDRNA